MYSPSNFRRILASALVGAATILSSAPALAQLADLADVPLAQAPTSAVLPNLTYILDDSGSMQWNYMPDQIQRSSRGDYFLNCKRCNLNDITVSSVSTGTERITASTSHGGAVGSTVVFLSGSPPAPLALNITYFMQSIPSGTTFTLAATSGGAAINLTSTTSGAVFVVNGGCVGPGGREDTNYSTTFANATGSPCGGDEPDPDTLLNDNASIPTYGEAPFYAGVFNKIWYNPNVTYSPGVDSTGTSLPIYPASAARRDGYLASPNDNLVSNFQEVVYCNVSSPSAAQLSNTAVCRYNGRHNVGPFLGGQPNYFLYFQNANNGGLPYGAFKYKTLVTNSNPHFYNITSHEYCSDVNLTTCALANAAGASPGTPFTIEAPVRWCKTAADAAATTVITGNSGAPATPRCRKRFERSTYAYPRYGRFQRVDITPAVPTYPRSAASVRTDCAAATFCSYAEELQNFANWYSYYRYRLALMKTATGRAFLTIDDRYRVGFITINPNNPVTASKFVPVAPFDAAQRSSFYTRLYAQSTNGGTPLREALSRVGRYYAGVGGGINAGMDTDPMTESCQTNYSLLTTDGYWNGNAGQNLGGSNVGNQDNSNSGFTTRGVGAYDGGLSGGDVANSLADVAAYYYKTDLRTSGPFALNNVPTSTKDTAAHQHMVTFTLGLGLEGFMDYIPDYETNTGGDFAKIKAATPGACSWTTGTCDWPIPAANEPSTLDDLWHAAVNGRGAYFSASDPNSLAQGLSSALAKLKVQTAAAAASATSSPNITQTENFIYSSTFRTGVWDGEIIAQRIDIATGNIIPAIEWSAQGLLDGRSTGNSDSRLIFTIDESGANKRKDFTFANLSPGPSGLIAAEQAYFANKCGAFAQCTLLTMAQQAIANSGTNLVNYLRGHREFEQFTTPETTSPFRFRDNILGDTVNSTPVFVKRPSAGYTDGVTPSYDDYRTAQAGRQGVLYVASNDGMLHALNSDTGQELWAYVPRITMPGLSALASANWGVTHRFNVDGSPISQDVFVGGQWKTIVVAGLNHGGRGYYALDVTAPGTPKVLWEICSDPTVCAITDADLGFSFGNPLITKRASDGKWVVFFTSGVNNVAPGDGRGYLYTVDVATGAILNKVTVGEGTVAAPLGLNRISGFADNPFTNNTAKFIYGGDLFGNVWKFDTATSPPGVSKLAQLRDSGGRPQSITTRPELSEIEGFPVVYVGTGRYLGIKDLTDPALLVPPQPFAYNNSIYGIKDRGVSYGNFRTGNVVQNAIIDGGTTRTTTQNPVDWTSQDGFYLDLNPGGTSPGERVNLDPQLVLGTLVVVGNVPNNTVCTVGGDAWVYFFDYKSGTNVSTSTGGIAGYKITGQTIVGFVIFSRGGNPASGGGGPGGGGPGSGGGGLDCYYTGATGEKIRYQCPVSGAGGKARRISWRELIQQ